MFLVKADCVLAGLDVALEAFRLLDPNVRTAIRKHDGDRCQAGEEIAEVVGSARALLIGERTALNLLQRLSGIATRARASSTPRTDRSRCSTRERRRRCCGRWKYAVRAGGAANHRAGLFDAVLIKDNHIRLAGGVKAAVERTRKTSGAACRSRSRSPEPRAGRRSARRRADIVLVDNMSTGEIREAVRRARGRAKVEISGGVTLERIPELAATGADYVSVGALTHSAPAVDISFELEPV